MSINYEKDLHLAIAKAARERDEDLISKCRAVAEGWLMDEREQDALVKMINAVEDLIMEVNE